MCRVALRTRRRPLIVSGVLLTAHTTQNCGTQCRSALYDRPAIDTQRGILVPIACRQSFCARTGTNRQALHHSASENAPVDSSLFLSRSSPRRSLSHPLDRFRAPPLGKRPPPVERRPLREAVGFRTFPNPRKQGNLGLAIAIAYLTRIGLDVAIPLTDTQ